MDKQISDQQYIRMTQTPVHSLVIRLCIPTVISMLVTNIYNMVDTAFVGKLGNSASGAVGVVVAADDFPRQAVVPVVGVHQREVVAAVLDVVVELCKSLDGSQRYAAFAGRKLKRG